jgi:hypothetical protein
MDDFRGTIVNHVTNKSTQVHGWPPADIRKYPRAEYTGKQQAMFRFFAKLLCCSDHGRTYVQYCKRLGQR